MGSGVKGERGKAEKGPELGLIGAKVHLTGPDAAPRNPAEPKDSDDESPQFPALAALPPPG
jgi:hypothetical protein